jgi:hypothetical protein
MALGADDAKIVGANPFSVGNNSNQVAVVIFLIPRLLQSPLAVGRFNEEYGEYERSELSTTFTFLFFRRRKPYCFRLKKKVLS